jgi:nucleoside-diphosphate-sugar epimerase
MKALVIGGTGPTGPHILAGLTQRGYDVAILHRGVHEPADLPDVRHIHADPHFLETLREGVGAETFDVVVGTYGRLKAIAVAFAGACGHLVCVSAVPLYQGALYAAGAYPYGLPVMAREDAPKASEGTSTAKMATLIFEAERSIFERCDATKTVASSVRYPHIYGPRNIVPWEWAVIKRVLDGRERMILPDDGLWILSRCAARNAAEVLLRVIDRPDVANGQAYNCADDDQFTVRQWAELVSEAAGRRLEFIGIPARIARSALSELLGPEASPHWLLSTRKAQSDLGYKDVVSARDALAETVDWLIQNPVTPSEYPVYGAKFDYELEDRLIGSYERAVERVLSDAPDEPLNLGHPMPHPKKPSLTTDARGR